MLTKQTAKTAELPQTAHDIAADVLAWLTKPMAVKLCYGWLAMLSKRTPDRLDATRRALVEVQRHIMEGWMEAKGDDVDLPLVYAKKAGAANARLILTACGIEAALALLNTGDPKLMEEAKAKLRALADSAMEEQS